MRHLVAGFQPLLCHDGGLYGEGEQSFLQGTRDPGGFDGHEGGEEGI